MLGSLIRRSPTPALSNFALAFKPGLSKVVVKTNFQKLLLDENSKIASELTEVQIGYILRCLKTVSDPLLVKSVAAKVLNAPKAALGSSSITLLLQCYKENRLPQEALRVYKTLSAEGLTNTQHAVVLFKALQTIQSHSHSDLSIADVIGDATAIYSSILKREARMNLILAASLFSLYAKVAALPASESYLPPDVLDQAIAVADAYPNVGFYTVAIKLAGSLNRDDVASSLFQQLLDRGITPNSHCVDHYLRTLLLCYQPDKCIEVFHALTKVGDVGWQVNSRVMCTLLSAYCDLGQYEAGINQFKTWGTRPENKPDWNLCRKVLTLCASWRKERFLRNLHGPQPLISSAERIVEYIVDDRTENQTQDVPYPLWTQLAPIMATSGKIDRVLTKISLSDGTVEDIMHALLQRFRENLKGALRAGRERRYERDQFSTVEGGASAKWRQLLSLLYRVGGDSMASSSPFLSDSDVSFEMKQRLLGVTLYCMLESLDIVAKRKATLLLHKMGYIPSLDEGSERKGESNGKDRRNIALNETCSRLGVLFAVMSEVRVGAAIPLVAESVLAEEALRHKSIFPSSSAPALTDAGDSDLDWHVRVREKVLIEALGAVDDFFAFKRTLRLIWRSLLPAADTDFEARFDAEELEIDSDVEEIQGGGYQRGDKHDKVVSEVTHRRGGDIMVNNLSTELREAMRLSYKRILSTSFIGLGSSSTTSSPSLQSERVNNVETHKPSEETPLPLPDEDLEQQLDESKWIAIEDDLQGRAVSDVSDSTGSISYSASGVSFNNAKKRRFEKKRGLSEENIKDFALTHFGMTLD